MSKDPKGTYLTGFEVSSMIVGGMGEKQRVIDVLHLPERVSMNIQGTAQGSGKAAIMSSAA